jgi:hypothetical protein
VGNATAGPENDLSPGGGRGRQRRVVARGVRRAQIDDKLLIQMLLMIAKDLERDGAADRDIEEDV